MRERFITFTTIVFLLVFLCEASAEDNFSIGLRLLENGEYSNTISDDAIGSFKKAFENDPSLGSKISQVLMAYSKSLAAKNNYYSIVGENAHTVLDDALEFDNSIRAQVIEYHLDYLKTLLENKDYAYADLYCIYISEYGAGPDAFKTVGQYEKQLSSDTPVDDFKKVYKCLHTILSFNSYGEKSLIDLSVKRTLNIYEVAGPVKSFEFASTICDIIDDETYVKTIVYDYRQLIKNQIDKGDDRAAIKLLDEFSYHFPKYFTEDDKTLLKDGITKILTNYDGEFIDLYDNFRLILSLRFFEDLDFNFLSNNFDIETEINVFEDFREPEETSYFYYDTGRLFSDSRGILLTDESLYWKNSIGDTQKLNFDNIDTVTLIYEKGLSLTGWKLRFNDNDDIELRLSRLDDEALIPFIGSLLYFINLNNNLNLVSLYIPESEKKILDGSVWQRHNGVIITTAVIAAVTVTYIATKDSAKVQAAENFVIEKLSSVASASAQGVKYVAAKAKYAPKAFKYGTNGLIKSLKSFEFYTKNGKKISGKLKDFYDKKKIVKMPFVGHISKDRTARGFLRDKNRFWEQFKKIENEALSKNNLNRIAHNESPIVDKKWISIYNNHKHFIGETLEHHHLNHGAKAVPLPLTLHRIGLNYGNWH